jgi:hypothetical protein
MGEFVMQRISSIAVTVILMAGSAWAEEPTDSNAVPAYAQAIINGADSGVVPAGCSSCATPLPAIFSSGGCSSCGPCACSEGDTCGSCLCKPGRDRCCPVEGCGDGPLGRFITSVARCLCCPDPCYEPVWCVTANSAFFMDTVRPRTYTRFRWDSGVNVTQPDRVEFFWARVQASGGGRGPRFAEPRVDYDELSLYQEVASGNFAFFIDVPYRAVYPTFNARHGNFGDLNLGTKSLIVDCELLNVSFQFRTFIPTASPQNGIGTGHTSLEPSFLASVKVMQDTYIQSQLAYWIPIGGDRTYQGATWHYHTSLNRLWWTKGALQLIGTSEFNGWTFTDGAVTNFVNRDTGVPVGASGESYITLGGGARLVFCEKWDIGFGAAFAVTSDHFAEQLYRTEVRFRY